MFMKRREEKRRVSTQRRNLSQQLSALLQPLRKPFKMKAETLQAKQGQRNTGLKSALHIVIVYQHNDSHSHVVQCNVKLHLKQ